MVEIEDLMRLEFGRAIEKSAKWFMILLGVIAFLVFFAIAPMHTLLLFGTLVLLYSIYAKPESDLPYILGIAMIILGFAGIFVPKVALTLQSYSVALRVADPLGLWDWLLGGTAVSPWMWMLLGAFLALFLLMFITTLALAMAGR